MVRKIEENPAFPTTLELVPRMPRPSRVGEGYAGGGCRIRKRGCSSSSSSSSVLQNYRLQRAVLVGKRGGASTPVPRWKMEAGSSSSTAGISEFSQRPPSHISSKGRHGPVSARKLASALWELNKIPSPMMHGELKEGIYKKAKRRERISKSIQSGSFPPHLSDPSHSPVSEVMDGSGSGVHRRQMPQMISQKLRIAERYYRVTESPSIGSLMETDGQSRGHTPSSIRCSKSHLRDLKKILNAVDELLKIVNHFWGNDEHQSSMTSILSALCAEQERASVLVDRLIEERQLDWTAISSLKKRFKEEKDMWKRKEQERIRYAVQFVGEELELEKKLRKRTERLNEKLVMELAEVKTSLAKAMQELENERRSREVLEQACGELVRGIGEDKAEVEEMIRESAKVQEELEREREMLQLADVWREERVHMKLTEAKFQLEEKNAAVDQLRNELEAFLVNKRARENLINHGNQAMDVEAEDHGQLKNQSKSCTVTCKNEDEVENEVNNEENGELDSVDSDLQSIELNMDSSSKSYKWSFATRDTRQDSSLPPIEEDAKGRNSSYEKPARNSFSVDRGASRGPDLSFNSKVLQDLGGVDFGKFIERNYMAERHLPKVDPEVERYKSVKGLRDRMLSSSKNATARGLTSPTRVWS